MKPRGRARRSPAQDAAEALYATVAGRSVPRGLARYRICGGADETFSVCDIWTGRPVVVARVAQVGLPRHEAEYCARLLNTFAGLGDRRIFQ